MATKRLIVPEIGEVVCVKSRRSRSLRLSVNQRGVRVTMPLWAPYQAAVVFVRQHQAWISEQRAQHTPVLLSEGQKIGKLHTVTFYKTPPSETVRARVTPTKLVIGYDQTETPTSPSVQTRALQASLKALRKEAATVLPPRLHDLAELHGLHYREVKIKQLTRRWGSCDSHGTITLNLFLVQLSWQQIDYVLCHELAHTTHMDHSAAFWHQVERMMPDARMIAKKVRAIQPALTPQQSATALNDDVSY